MSSVDTAIRFARRTAGVPAQDDLVVQLKSCTDPKSPEFEAAVTSLYAKYGRLIGLVCRKRLASHRLPAQQADELIRNARNDAFVSLVKRRQRLADQNHARNWWKKVALHRLIDALRKLDRQPALESAVDPSELPQGPHAERDEELLVALDGALDALPKKYAAAVRLCHLDGLTQAEAAARLGVREGTISSRVSRGMARLREDLHRRGVAMSAAVLAALLPELARASRLPRPVAAQQVALVLARLAADAGGAKVWWLVGAAVALTGGLAAGGWALAPGSSPEPVSVLVPVVVPPPATVQAETVERRNERLFREKVLPRQLAALKPLALGGGTVELLRAGPWDTKFEAVYVLRHALPGVPESRVWLISDSDSRRAQVLFAVRDERFELVRTDSQGRPSLVLVGRSRVFPRDVTVPVGPLVEARAAFAELPKDELTRAAAEVARDRMAAAATPYVGVWLRNGDPGQRCELKLKDGYPVVTQSGGYFWGDGDGHLFFRLAPDGRPEGLHAFGGPVAFAPDRITFANGEFWTRAPLPGR